MSFERDIIDFRNKSLVQVDRIRRGVILKLFSAVILDTPVQTGLLRSNWQTSVGRPNDKVINTASQGGNAAMQEISSNLGMFGDDVHMTINLPYARVAEYGLWNGPTAKVNAKGFSKKAPSGMMRKNVIRIKKHLKKLVK